MLAQSWHNLGSKYWPQNKFEESNDLAYTDKGYCDLSNEGRYLYIRTHEQQLSDGLDFGHQSLVLITELS